MLGMLIQLKYIQKELHRKIKNLLMILIMIELNFLSERNILARLKKRTKFALTCSVKKNRLTFAIYDSHQKFENSMDLLLAIDKSKSHYVYIKYFDRFIFHKAKKKNKKHFYKSCLQCLSRRNMWTEHKKVCLSINCAQSVRIEKVTIEFENYLKQIQFHLKFMLILSVI